MEIYEEVFLEKAKKIIRKAIIFVGILVVGIAVYFFAFGVGNGFWKNETAIAIKSFKGAFGFSSNENFKEITIENTSSTYSFVDDILRGATSTATDITENSPKRRFRNENISGRSELRKSPVEDGISDSGVKSAREMPDGKQAITSVSAVAESVASGSDFASDSTPGIATSSSLGVEKKSSSRKVTATRCAFPIANAPTSTHTIILNEIAWMGSLARNGESNAIASNDEWIEIKNETPNTISLADWQLIDTAKNITIFFGDKDIIASSSFYLLKRTDDHAILGIPADKIYSGSLPNEGDTLGIFDDHCGLVDFLDASEGWLGGDNGVKRTLECDRGGSGWHTSADPGGTPKAENSNGYTAPVVVSASPSSTQVISGVSSSTPKYIVSVAIAGDGVAKVISKPAGINCNSYCEGSYSVGQTVTLHAIPAANTVFSGWSGPCSGTADCVFVVTGYVSVTAFFHGTGFSMIASVPSAVSNADNFSVIAMATSSSLFSDAGNVSSSSISDGSQSSSTYSTASSTDNTALQTPTSSPTVVSTTTSTPIISHLVIAAVQIAGASSTNDFVKIYNPANNTIDIGGWKLRKKSSTGADYSLREIPAGSLVPIGGYFAWANSINEFSTSVGANVSSTETLSTNNSVALLDANSTVIDAVAWGTGINQYVEGAAYPTNPAASQALVRIFQNGAIVDTDNNAADFLIQ